VVVQRWDNRAPASDGIVYLTNGCVKDPFVVFDTSDWRSVIENGMFKEGKHPWHLGHFPKKTEAAVIVHAISRCWSWDSVQLFACGKPNLLPLLVS
jgi:hypothetical protein